jgi:hypothetical protein
VDSPPLRQAEHTLASPSSICDMPQHLVEPILMRNAVERGTHAALRITVLQAVRRHLSDPDLSHDRVAAAHRRSRRSLHRLFEREPHSVTDHLRLQRLEAARRDLTDPLAVPAPQHRRHRRPLGLPQPGPLHQNLSGPGTP